LREEHRLRVLESRMLRKIFGPKREDGSWRKLYNDELHGLLKKLIVTQLVKKFSQLYGTRRFISVFARSCFEKC
jgi:hypothetical protein